MGKAMEQLAKNLANGMSRRRALWRFGAGFPLLGLLSTNKAKADGKENCLQFSEGIYETCISKGGSGFECVEALEGGYQCCLQGYPLECCYISIIGPT